MTRGHSARRARVLLAALIVALQLAVPALVFAGQSWAITADLSSVPSGSSTSVAVRIVNTSGNSSSGEGIGCVTISIPAAFTVNTATKTSVTSSLNWSVSKTGSGPTVVTAQAADNGNRLLGSPVKDEVVLDLSVTGGAQGSYVWTADEYQDWDCTGDFHSTVLVPMTIAAPANVAPVAVDDSYAAATNVALIIPSTAGVLANDTDANGDILSASVVSNPSSGVLALASDGSFVYTPTPGFSGSDSFVYAAFDGTFSATATASIGVSNSAPSAVDDAYSGKHDSSIIVPAPGVLSNDSDPNGDSMSAALVTPASFGTISLAADGSFTYTPVPGFVGTDSFSYDTSDGQAFDNATVAIVITNASPMAVDDVDTVGKNLTLTVGAPGVLGNDGDTDGDTLTASLLTGPANGSATVSADGSYVYTPSGGFVGDGFVHLRGDRRRCIFECDGDDLNCELDAGRGRR